jgi:hypothetical protein
MDPALLPLAALWCHRNHDGLTSTSDPAVNVVGRSRSPAQASLVALYHAPDDKPILSAFRGVNFLGCC